jgi:hypothetical protein
MALLPAYKIYRNRYVYYHKEGLFFKGKPKYFRASFLLLFDR